MGGDRRDDTIDLLNGTNEKTNKAMKTETVRVNTSRAAPGGTGKLPTEKDSGIDQYQANAEQEKAQGRSERGGQSPHTAQETIAALDAEAPTVLVVNLIRRPIQMDHDKQHPLAAPLRGLVRDKRGDHRQVSRRAIGEGIGGQVAAASCTQAASAFVFAANGASDEGGLLAGGQITDDPRRGKAFIQIQNLRCEAQRFQSPQQSLQNSQGVIIRQNINDRQAQTHLPPDHIGAGDPNEMGRAFLGWSSARPRFDLWRFAIERLIMIIDGNFYACASHAEGNTRHQSSVHLGFLQPKIRPLQSLLQMFAHRIAVGNLFQIGTGGLNTDFFSAGFEHNVPHHRCITPIACYIQRHVFSQGLDRLKSDVFRFQSMVEYHLVGPLRLVGARNLNLYRRWPFCAISSESVIY